MTPFIAHGILAKREENLDFSVFPKEMACTITFTPANGDPARTRKEIPCWPATCVALAGVSGALADAKTEEELDKAIEHGFFLIREQIVGDEEFELEFENCVKDIMRWGDAFVGGL